MHKTPDSAWLEALVVKNGVALGGLNDPQRRLALALVWAGLPAVPHVDEAGINLALKSLLAGAARCLGTDPVELRRWLVDSGFLQRDGYGRRYVQTALQALAPAARKAAESILAAAADHAVADWVEQLRSAKAERRAASRSSWLARCGAAAGGLG